MDRRKNGDWPLLLWFFAVATSVKLLLMPSYRSTDFEVHRNWLAITHSLPFTKWYFDETSPWTLDYPPFFAYFELFLSFFCASRRSQDRRSSIMTRLQRRICNLLPADQRDRLGSLSSLRCLQIDSKIGTNEEESDLRIGDLVSGAIYCRSHSFSVQWISIGLVNAFDFVSSRRERSVGWVLLCFKHLFAVAAPVYFVYLLRHYCWSGLATGFRRVVTIGLVVVPVFSAAYGPFIYHGQIEQLIRRMFPFGRGLCHAYWAPNVWVFYIIIDKGLAFSLRSLGFEIKVPSASFTGGLVGESSPFAVLPQITPLTTFAMVLLAISPCLIKAWNKPHPGHVARWIAYAYTCGFLFGWHVHEKASLLIIVPLAIVAVQNLEDAKHYFLVCIVSCYSLFPLLYELREYLIKVLLLLLHSMVMWLGFAAQYAVDNNKAQKESGEIKSKFRIGCFEKSYLMGLIIVEMVSQFLHYFLGHKFPFMPLMLISTYCTIGIIYSWISQLRSILLT